MSNFCTSLDIFVWWCKLDILIFFNCSSIIKGTSYNLTRRTHYCKVSNKMCPRFAWHYLVPCGIFLSRKSRKQWPNKKTRNKMGLADVKCRNQLLSRICFSWFFTVRMNRLILTFQYSESVRNNDYVYTGSLFFVSPYTLQCSILFTHSHKRTHLHIHTGMHTPRKVWARKRRKHGM